MDDDKYDSKFNKFKAVERYRELGDQCRSDESEWKAWFNNCCNWFMRINGDMEESELIKAKLLENNISFAIYNVKNIAPELLFQKIREYEILLETVSDRIFSNGNKKRGLHG